MSRKQHRKKSAISWRTFLSLSFFLDKGNSGGKLDCYTELYPNLIMEKGKKEVEKGPLSPSPPSQKAYTSFAHVCESLVVGVPVPFCHAKRQLSC